MARKFRELQTVKDGLRPEYKERSADVPSSLAWVFDSGMKTGSRRCANLDCQGFPAGNASRGLHRVVGSKRGMSILQRWLERWLSSWQESEVVRGSKSPNYIASRGLMTQNIDRHSCCYLWVPEVDLSLALHGPPLRGLPRL